MEAFQGVEKLLSISGTDMDHRAMQHENTVMAASQAGVRHIGYTSFERNNEAKCHQLPENKTSTAHVTSPGPGRMTGSPW